MEELFKGLPIILLYFAVAASAALFLQKLIKIPQEVFRKLLHFILLGALFVWTVVFETWYISALSAVGVAVALYPVLVLLERTEFFCRVMPQRKNGEFKSSLLVVFIMYALVSTVCWGILGDRLLGLCSIYAWGFGDAAAALIGKRFGKHGISGKHIEGRKSFEGTYAMFVVSFISVLLILIYRGGMAWYVCAGVAAITAAVSATVELFSLKGLDTLFCPLFSMSVLLPLIQWFGGGIL